MPLTSLRPHLALLVALLLACAGTASSGPGAGSHGDCTNCHGTSVATGAGESARGVAACESCHRIALRSAGWAGHAPDIEMPAAHAGLECVACHDPHGSGGFRGGVDAAANSASRLDDASRMCLTCHEGLDQSAGRGGHFVRHPIGIVPRLGFVTAGYTKREESGGGIARVALPLAHRATAPGGDEYVLACTTCHFPHAAPNPYLLRWSRDEQIEACGGCHSDVIEPAPAIAGGE